MSATTDKLSGRIKKAAGSLGGDRHLQNKGEAEEKSGTLKAKLGHVIDKIAKK